MFYISGIGLQIHTISETLNSAQNNQYWTSFFLSDRSSATIKTLARSNDLGGNVSGGKRDRSTALTEERSDEASNEPGKVRNAGIGMEMAASGDTVLQQGFIQKEDEQNQIRKKREEGHGSSRAMGGIGGGNDDTFIQLIS